MSGYDSGLYGSGPYGYTAVAPGSYGALATWNSLEVTWNSLVATWHDVGPPRSPKPTALTIGVWEPESGSTWRQVGEVRTWTTVAVEPRYNDPGPWSLTMPYDAQALSITKNRLLTFELDRDSGNNRLMTGVVVNHSPAQGETGGMTLEASGADALILLQYAECWPNPTLPLDGQTATHYTATGPTETVLRDLCNLNMVTRRGDPLVVAASAGRGKTITLKEPLGAKLLEVVKKRADAANLGVRLGLVRTTSATRAELRLEFYRGTDVSQRVRLSHNVGNLRSWKQTDSAPTGTRAIVAGSAKMTPLGIEFINLADDKMTTTTNTHTLKTGARLFVNGPVSPLSASTTYFVIRVDADTIKVAESRSKALKGTAVKITTAGLRVEKVNLTPNAITITKGDVPDTGSRIRFYGDAPAPLNTGTVYYAIKVDRDTFKAAATLAAATNGNEINLTNDGSGAIYVYEAGSVTVVEVARTIREVRAGGGVESEWGWKIETFVDASGEDHDDLAELLEKGETALAEMTAKSGFELDVVESAGVRLFQHFNLGDTVAIELSTSRGHRPAATGTVAYGEAAYGTFAYGEVPRSSAPSTGLSRTERLTAAQIEGGSGGITIKLVPGNPDASEPLFRQADIIRGIRRDIRAQQREEG